MAQTQFAVVDVFSKTPYKGNPLAVVNDLKGELSDTEMKLITRQFNLSETTFFLHPSLPEAHYKLRSFLPDGREVFGVGHNILGAWWYLAHAGLLDFSKSGISKGEGVEEFTFYQELGGSVTPVKILKSRVSSAESTEFSVSITQATPKAHGRHPNVPELAATIGLGPEDIGLASGTSVSRKQDVIPRVMSTSTTHHLLVPVASIAALERASVQREKLLEQLQLADERAYGLYLFAKDDREGASVNTYQARFFSPGMSTEDPATGSAAGPLSEFLRDEGLLELVDNKASIEVWQGLQVGRECLIKVNLAVDGNTPVVDVSGSGVLFSEGRLASQGSQVGF
jgi:PhzF family phenazine biosynthesis protein